MKPSAWSVSTCNHIRTHELRIQQQCLTIKEDTITGFFRACFWDSNEAFINAKEVKIRRGMHLQGAKKTLCKAVARHFQKLANDFNTEADRQQ